MTRCKREQWAGARGVVLGATLGFILLACGEDATAPIHQTGAHETQTTNPTQPDAAEPTRATGPSGSLPQVDASAAPDVEASAARAQDAGNTSGALTGSDETADRDTSPVLARDAAISDGSTDILRGKWYSRSWGLVLEAADGVLSSFEVTSISCRPYFVIPYQGTHIPDLGTDARLDGDELVFDLLGTGELRAQPIDRLPATCNNGGTPDSDDPVLAFEIFWHNFDEMYSSFDLRGMDWDAQYRAFVDRVTEDTTPEELFASLCEMTQPLEDPHVSVSYGEQACSKTPPEWLGDDTKVAAMLDAVQSQIYERSNTAANGAIAYRVLPENLGYVFIPSMGSYAQTPDEDVSTAIAAIDEIVAAFAGVDGVIIDLRLNSGGSDEIAFLFASRFADQKRLAFSVQTRDGEDWSQARNYYVEPDGPVQFLGPVVLLTTQATVSAAESFELAMHELPQVSILGEASAGAYSNAMDRNLPNGFAFTLPFERVFAADGKCYEGVGVKPDVEVAFDADAFVAGTDSMLEAAVAQLTGQ
ncbi:MAG TPA: S41 family peptidase [Polyangiaceae bacterium]|nr:S41 family peptidase [Polyangiaceae bacterium]